MTDRLFFIMMMFLVMGIFSVNYSQDVFACSCANITELEALEKSSASFVGTPVKIESPTGFNNIVTFQVESPVKNIGENTTEITVITNAQGSACGYNFENNTRYLVHTYGDANQKNLETGLCSGNTNLGFSEIPLDIVEHKVMNYSESLSVYQFVWYAVIVGMTLAVVIGIIVYTRKKRKSKI